MAGLTPGHLLVALIAFVVLFGAKKLPEAARGLGRSARILKAEVNGLHDDEPVKGDTARSDVEPQPKAVEARSTTRPADQATADSRPAADA